MLKETGLTCEEMIDIMDQVERMHPGGKNKHFVCGSREYFQYTTPAFAVLIYTDGIEAWGSKNWESGTSWESVEEFLEYIK